MRGRGRRQYESGLAEYYDLHGKHSEKSKAARCERGCVARGGVMCVSECAAGSDKEAAVQGAKSRAVGLCVEGVGMVGARGVG